MKDVEPRPALGTALEHGRAIAPTGDGGDSACWLDRVCDECGRLAEGHTEICPVCGEAMSS